MTVLLLVLGLVSLGGPAGAATLQVDFSYRVDFIDALAGAVLGLDAGDAVIGRAFVDADLLDAAGDGLLPADPFQLEVGALSFAAADDVFGGPLVEFTAATARGVLFATGFTVGAEAFFLELGFSLTGDPELRLTSEVGALIGAGPLVSAVVPGPATLVTLLAGGLLLVAARAGAAVSGMPRVSRAWPSTRRVWSRRCLRTGRTPPPPPTCPSPGRRAAA